MLWETDQRQKLGSIKLQGGVDRILNMFWAVHGWRAGSESMPGVLRVWQERVFYLLPQCWGDGGNSRELDTGCSGPAVPRARGASGCCILNPIAQPWFRQLLLLFFPPFLFLGKMCCLLAWFSRNSAP